MIVPTYVIGAGGRNITCLDCGMTSWHREDIANRYCAQCHEFHNDKEIRKALRAPGTNDDRFPEWS